MRKQEQDQRNSTYKQKVCLSAASQQ